MTYHQLATQLAMDGTTVTREFSPAMSMDGLDAAQINATVLRQTGTNVKATLQESNDRENFRNISGTTETFAGEGYFVGTKRTGIASRWLRVMFEFTGTSLQLAVIAAGVNLSKQG